ncbi:hypothetical protein F8A86_09880 [Betaproteobacteria bacterium SCN1]|nr:hypothetical protein F8A86_09880 [Betaproteobacteria bacterium SCN1]
MTKKKSKKPFASNSAAPPEQIPLFVDRCAWSRLLGEALDKLGAPYIAHHQRFAPDAPDEAWLEVAGREGWIVITRDKHIRRRPAELDAFRTHQVTVFVFAGGNASAAETAELVTRSAANRIWTALLIQSARCPLHSSFATSIKKDQSASVVLALPINPDELHSGRYQKPDICLR